MARKGHRLGKVATHQCCAGNTWYVMLEEDEMQKTLGNTYFIPEIHTTCTNNAYI